MSLEDKTPSHSSKIYIEEFDDEIDKKFIKNTF
jgi:hypothetical protein